MTSGRPLAATQDYLPRNADPVQHAVRVVFRFSTRQRTKEYDLFRSAEFHDTPGYVPDKLVSRVPLTHHAHLPPAHSMP